MRVYQQASIALMYISTTFDYDGSILPSTAENSNKN